MRTVLFCLLLPYITMVQGHDIDCLGLMAVQQNRWLDSAEQQVLPGTRCQLHFTGKQHELDGPLPFFGRYQLFTNNNSSFMGLEQGLYADRQGYLVSLIYQQWQSSEIISLNDAHVYQSNSGLLALNPDAELTINSSAQQLESRLYFTHYLPQMLRYVGLYWRYQLQPAEITVASDIADLYDTEINLWGVSLGRDADDKGLSFSWHLAMGQGVMKPDGASISEHHEYNLWHLQLDMQWQYRYYFAPYWYGIVSTGLSAEQWQSGAINPSTIKFRPYHQYQGHLGLGLRYYF